MRLVRLSGVGLALLSVSLITAGIGDGPRGPAHAIVARDDVFEADNPDHGFRARFDERGVQLGPREGMDVRPWSLGLVWVGYGRGEASDPVPAGSLSATAERIDLLRGGFVEWYENGPRGLKQGFLLPEPPGGAGVADGWIHLDLQIEGTLHPRVAEDAGSVEFGTSGGLALLHYAELVVLDAGGRTLPSRMDVLPGGGGRVLRLSFDATGAAFPVSVDPLSTSALWVDNDGVQALAEQGKAVATAGDVDGDGFSEVIVGEPLYDGSLADEGRVTVFWGSPTGPWNGFTIWNPEGDQAGSRFGSSVATAGDVNGDGYADVIVGAPYFDNGQTDEGRAYVYLGSAAGLPAAPNWMVESDQAGSRFGTSVACAGDVNNDGYSDVLVGAPFYDNGQVDEGRAFLYLGSASGLSTVPAWTGESEFTNGQYGHSLGTAGDVNGDGFSDVVVGIPNYSNGQLDEGRAYVYHGAPTNPLLVLAWTKEMNHADAYFGWSAATAGDVNADGYADVIVGEPFYFTSPTLGGGRAYVFHGSIGGLSSTENWMTELTEANAAYGWSVGTAGDVNGNGVSDVIVGSPWEDLATSGLSNVGRARVYSGSGPFSSLTLAGQPWSALPGQVSSRFGEAMAADGDVNGDGYADVLVGAPWFDFGALDEGRALLYLGTASGLPLTPSWTADGTQVGAHQGTAVAFAGDVNGDGYDDLLVGAPDYDTIGLDAGRVVLYHGSASGPSSQPSWSWGGEQAGMSFGASVASAGDVNGDGYDDVLIGAPLWDGGQTDEGRVYLFPGSPTGLSTYSWTSESDQAGAQTGNAVAGAGDVNGDGYDDVAVGAWLYDGPGATEAGHASVFHGSPSGLTATPAWTTTGTVTSRLGTSLDSAGDVDRDGYADLVVGKPGPNAARPFGEVLLFNGSAAGLKPLVWSFPADSSDGAEYGYRVAGAGDVHGDGYADFVVTGRAAGNVTLYAGCAACGMFQDGRVQGSGEFGTGLGAGGDVNGDGVADIAVGAPDFLAQGQANLYTPSWAIGSAPMGLSRLRQRRSDDTRPISFGGVSDVQDAFRVLGSARSLFGRASARLEVEVKPLATAFDGQASQAGPTVDLGTTGASLPLLVSGLSEGSLLHWRARLRNDAVTAPLAPPRTAWLTIPWSGWKERELRTAGVIQPVQTGPMSMAKTATPGDLQLSWEPACNPNDTDYAVYEGLLGSAGSHVPVTCSTAGATSWTFTPAGGDRYYLVVPRNADVERSYGTTGTGSQRPPSASACLPQNLGVCP